MSACLGAMPHTGGNEGPSGSTVMVNIRNTFINVEEEKPLTAHGRDRSASPPGSHEKVSNEDRSTEFSASEEAEDLSVGDASTECGASVSEEQPWTPKIAPPVPTSTPPLVLLFPAPPPAAPTPYHQSTPSALNPAAKAWEPRGGPKPSRKERSSSNRQIAEITEKICAMLAACFHLTGTEVAKTLTGWTVTAEIQKHDLIRKETILARAKDVMLAAVEASKSVYMLGYRARPFVPTPVGFAAKFAVVTDEHSACWGLLQHGYCRHGENCRWKHPTCQVSVNVALRIAAAP